jgi:hypothetical protein
MAQSVQMLLLISYCLNTMVGKGALKIQERKIVLGFSINGF